MEKKLNKVVFHYDDGSAKQVTGIELDRWLGFSSQSAVMLAVRGQNPNWDEVKWEHIEPNQPEQKVEDVDPESLKNVKSSHS